MEYSDAELLAWLCSGKNQILAYGTVDGIATPSPILTYPPAFSYP